MRKSSMIERASVYTGSLFILTSITAPQCTKIITLITTMPNPRTTFIFSLLTTSVANWQYEIFFIILCFCLHWTLSSTHQQQMMRFFQSLLQPCYRTTTIEPVTSQSGVSGLQYNFSLWWLTEFQENAFGRVSLFSSKPLDYLFLTYVKKLVVHLITWYWSSNSCTPLFKPMKDDEQCSCHCCNKLPDCTSTRW